MAFRNTALELTEPGEPADDEAWAERAEHWRDPADPPEGLPSLWDRRERQPLVLAGHGVRLRIRHASLDVTYGLTHHPQRRRVQLFFPGDRKMPSRIVLLDASGAITFDVVEFLARHDITLVMLDFRGRLVGSLGGRPGVSDIGLQRSQLDAVEAQAAVAYFAGWLDVPIRWKGTGRRPIPPEWYRMPLRSSLLGRGNRHSGHPVMSLQNYA